MDEICFRQHLLGQLILAIDIKTDESWGGDIKKMCTQGSNVLTTSLSSRYVTKINIIGAENKNTLRSVYTLHRSHSADFMIWR